MEYVPLAVVACGFTATVQAQPPPDAEQVADENDFSVASLCRSCEQVVVTPSLVRQAAGTFTTTLPEKVKLWVYVSSAAY